MKLLNFSVGQVQTVEIRGASVRTAHVKTPVAEPWLITADGAQGDQRAVHPDKVYAYARTHYQYWRRHLDVNAAEWQDGYFGENLTFDELDEGELRVGDVFALGDEVQLVVAGPRHPCAKLCWRLNQPPTFQRVFQTSRHTGVYFGVIRSGRVRPGDVARRIVHDATMPCVSEVAQFVTDHATPPLDPLQRLLASEHLSKGLRFFLQAKVDQAARAAAATDGRWRGWREFVIQRIVEETPDVRSIHVVPADGEKLCQPRPGQFVTVQDDQHRIQRCWSLSHYAERLSAYRLTVRRLRGAGSNWFHRARIGGTVRLRAPAGHFVLDCGSVRPLVLVGGGIGITPLLAMLQAHVARGAGAPPAYLVYGVRTPADVVFREELEAIAASQPNVRVHYIYSRSDDGARPAGRITTDLLLEVLGDVYVMLGDRRIALPWYESDIYICGPGDFCQRTKDELVARGANADHIFLELFSVATRETTELDSAQIRFHRSRITRYWHADDDFTLLELAEQAGIEVENDCRAGACLSCRTRIIEGAITADLGDGSGLLCVGRPKTAIVTLDR
jgi:ferredoxin-NADP reductase/MOSC domain-containing protein YiiM